LIDVAWDVSPTDAHIVDVEIEAADRAGLLQDVMSVLSEHKTNATSVTARTKRDGSASISCSLEIRDLNHLSQLLQKLGRVRDVRNAYRVTKREARVGDR
jgi:GTP pyrophosphokinase